MEGPVHFPISKETGNDVDFTKLVVLGSLCTETILKTRG